MKMLMHNWTELQLVEAKSGLCIKAAPTTTSQSTNRKKVTNNRCLSLNQYCYLKLLRFFEKKILLYKIVKKNDNVVFKFSHSSYSLLSLPFGVASTGAGHRPKSNLRRA